jgi:predicted aspartyl protease
MSRSMLKDSKAEYRVTEPNVIAMTADGRRTQAQGVVIAALRVGPHDLRNVRALVCDHCVPLLGQSALAQFDMQSSRVQGVDFMTLTRRQAR